MSLALLVAPGTALSHEPFAIEGDDGDSSSYGVLFGVSPFGGSATFSRHVSKKTTWQFSIGGTPNLEFDVPIKDVEYTMRSHSTWVGCFVNHRPVERALWFRLVTGFAIGVIDNQLEDSDGNTFLAEYRESPVAYMGFGFGATTRRGITVGFDIGWLQSAGPRLSYVKGQLSDEEQARRLAAIDGDFFFGSFLPNIQAGVGYNF